MISFSYVLHYIIFAIFLYFSFFIIICLLMYTLAIVGVYACLASRGEWPEPACLPVPLPEKHREAAADLTLSFIQGSSFSSCNRLLRSLGRAPSKRSSRLTAAARSFLRDFTIFILYLIYRHQIFCASSASARASLRAAAFSFSITAWKEKTSSLMTGARTRMEIRFGIAMRAFAISERFQTRSRV